MGNGRGVEIEESEVIGMNIDFVSLVDPLFCLSRPLLDCTLC